MFETDEITIVQVMKAISQFKRTFVSFNSKYDQYLRGEVTLSNEEFRGMTLFFTEKGDCFHCHGNMFFTTHSFHNNGIQSIITDIGLEAVTGMSSDMGLFKTPTLRNTEVSGPYMHGAQFDTLEEVVDHYNSGGHITDTIDPLIRELNLTDEEKEDLVLFLKTLADWTFIENSNFQNPF